MGRSKEIEDAGVIVEAVVGIVEVKDLTLGKDVQGVALICGIQGVVMEIHTEKRGWRSWEVVGAANVVLKGFFDCLHYI